MPIANPRKCTSPAISLMTSLRLALGNLWARLCIVRGEFVTAAPQGPYAAGMALDQAGVKGQGELLARIKPDF